MSSTRTPADPATKKCPESLSEIPTMPVGVRSARLASQQRPRPRERLKKEYDSDCLHNLPR